MSTYELSYLKIRYPMTLKLLVCFRDHPVSLINLVSNFSLLIFCPFQFDLISDLQKISQRVTGNSCAFFNQFCILLTCSPFSFAGLSIYAYIYMHIILNKPFENKLKTSCMPLILYAQCVFLKNKGILLNIH